MADPVYPKAVSPTWPQIQKAYGDWLFKEMGMGLPSYPNQLSPDISKTMLPGVWGGWQPNVSDRISGNINNVYQQGGMQGWPLSLMHNMAQFGGTGGPGNYGMSNLMQFGAAGQAGAPMQQRAWGRPSPALSYLAPFMTMGMHGYNSPTIPGFGG